MPAFYAHYRFGCEALEIAALESAPSAIQTLCRENRALFDIGLHGPDLFFFYRPGHSAGQKMSCAPCRAR